MSDARRRGRPSIRRPPETIAVMTMPLLSMRDLHVTVDHGAGRVPVVRGLSLDIAAGSALGLVGESGCGKSLTALSILRLADAGGVRTAGGQIHLHGRDLVAATEAELCAIRGRKVAMIFQDAGAALNPVMPIGKQIAEPLRIHSRMPRAAAQLRAIELLDAVGIADAAARVHAYPHQLSGGMKQRVLIAIALSCDPDLLIADEPTTALDVTVQAQILDLLDEQRRARGMALLFVSHDLAVVGRVCDEIAVMYAGRIVERARTSTLLRHPRHPYARGLLRALGSIDAGGTHAGTRSALHEIPGTVPALGDLADRKDGCAFADRCDRALDLCREENPDLVTIGLDRHLRCHNPDAV